jgi:Tol biopolymer transport system component
MSIHAGQYMGSYEVTSLLGKGGMGEVYRARDTKLKRDVAIKILPDEFSRDADRVARFQREAEVLASLSHPNIAGIYDLQLSGDMQFLVLELVEGETLADRIRRGPLPVEEALQIGKSICEALEAAHERGIVHRDLKPANIKITPDGKVKVLDFGLAKALDGETRNVDLSNSPTLMSGSMSGTILGTTAYMSPEQAKGVTLDRRTDIFAFGAVLYEMLVAQRAFPGETVSEIVAAVIRAEPDWNKLPAHIPSGIRRLLSRCLQKDRSRRLRDIADARFQIEEAVGDTVGSATTAQSRRGWTGWIVAAVVLGTALFFATRPSINFPSAAPISFAVFPPEGTVFSAALNTTVNVPQFALSPDGANLVFVAEAPGATPMLWVRAMNQVRPRQLAGTEEAQGPFWSPDSRWIGFFAQGKLKKVPAAGGPVQIITQAATDNRGGTWGPEDNILLGWATEEPILQVKSFGGKSSPVTTLDISREGGTDRNPYFLPDGKHFLYSFFGRATDQNGVYLGSLNDRNKTLLVRVDSNAVYVPPGYLLFVDGDILQGQSFDLQRLQLTGQPFFVAEHVGRNSAFMSAVSASGVGTIAYAGTIAQNGRLTWIDRSGNTLGTAGTPDGDYVDFRLSPDDKRLGVSLVNVKAGTVEIWLADLARNSISRFASGGLVTGTPIWSPDGTRLAFRTNRNGIIEFYERSAAGGGSDRPILLGEAYRAAQIPSNNLIPTDWSPDGQTIIFSVPSPESGNDLWLLPVTENGKPEKFLASPAEQLHGNFSPDGHLVAYSSNESGRFEVYVETIPQSDRKLPVSTEGGYEPRWRADGGEIYYLSEDRKLMAVSVGPGPSFGVPKILFQTRVPAGVTANRTHYVPSRDGRRFLVNTQTGNTPPTPITVVLNWKPPKP